MTDSSQMQVKRVSGAGELPVKPAASSTSASSAQATSFAQVLEAAQGVKFSNHAQSRIQSRDINLSSESVSRLSSAIDKAVKRGGKSSLVMVDDMAFIVNLQNRTVVTALDKDQRGEGVFTQIDSVVFADPADGARKSTIDVKG